MKKNIICITPIEHIEGALEALEACGDVSYFPYIEKMGLRREIISKKINTIFTNPNKQTFKIDKELLEESDIKIICTASTGLNHIDRDYCIANNIKVMSLTTDYDVIKRITSTAEMAFSLMLSLIRNIPKAIEGASKYEWDYEKYIGRQLSHLVSGVIGYGRLGKHYARFCQSFFSSVVITDPYKEIDEWYVNSELNYLLDKSDVIALHVHLIPETYHMINDKTINKMKDGVYLVNTSRGDIVDEEAVIKHIKNGKVKGYATDVISNELGNRIEDSPLIKAMNEGHNIIITPHIAGMTREAQEIAYLNSIKKLRDMND